MKSKITMPKKKENPIVFHHVSDETVSIHASNFLPRPANINPLAHHTLNRSIELSKRSNDKLGVFLKKPNTMLYMAIAVIAIVVVGYLIYDDQAKQGNVPAIGGNGPTAKPTQHNNGSSSNGTPQPQQHAGPPSPTDIIPFPNILG